MDSENFDLDFVEAYKSIEAKDKSMQEVVFSNGEQRFGAYVSFPRMTGNEFGECFTPSAFMGWMLICLFGSLARILW